MHGELGKARLRGVARKHSTREPDPDNAGGGIAITINKKIPPRPGGIFFTLPELIMGVLI
jgi:hypothetical protein